jgi:hypothetical protein
VAVLALPAQVADKVCALFERHGADRKPSSRARDLADVAMIALQKDVDGTVLGHHLKREEARRLQAGTLLEPLPRHLLLDAEQIADWGPRWRKATRGAPIEFVDAQKIAAGFIDPVLNGAADGKVWSSGDQDWV